MFKLNWDANENLQVPHGIVERFFMIVNFGVNLKIKAMSVRTMQGKDILISLMDASGLSDLASDHSEAPALPSTSNK